MWPPEVWGAICNSLTRQRNWPSTCGNDLVGARGFDPRTSSVSRNERHATYRHKCSLSCGVVFVVARHVPVITLRFAGFPRDGILPPLPRDSGTASLGRQSVAQLAAAVTPTSIGHHTMQRSPS